MKTISSNGKYIGEIKSPSSKSYMQRAIAIALLANGTTKVNNPCFCNDVYSVLEIAKQMGAKVQISDSEVWITPSKKTVINSLNVGESGLGIRMLSPVVSLYPEEITLIGEGSLKKRPVDSIEDALGKLGVEVSANNGYLPIQVKGPIKGGQIEVDGSLSSQVLTGLLIALPMAKDSSVIDVLNLKSRPYIDMTIEIMSHFGVQVTHEAYKRFSIAGNQKYTAKTYSVEGDWSGAAFHLVGGAIAGDVTLKNINPNSVQADMKILEALTDAGAHVTITENTVQVQKNQLNAFTFDAIDCPDLFPPLANLAAVCSGTSVIKGVSRLIHKESNRANAIQKEWHSLGVDIKIRGDEMHIKGGVVSGGEIDSHNDHRIAMMGAIASLVATSAIQIKNPEAVGKSYPLFFEDFNKLSICI